MPRHPGYLFLPSLTIQLAQDILNVEKHITLVIKEAFTMKKKTLLIYVSLILVLTITGTLFLVLSP